MKIIVTAQGSDIDALTSSHFGRCPTYVLVETETMAFEALANPATDAAGGAGIQGAQFVVERGAQAVLTGNVGPNAVEVLQAADIPIYVNSETDVRSAVEAFKAGRLSVVKSATADAHAGMGVGQARKQPAASVTARETEIAALKTTATELRQQLADVIESIDKLAKET